MSSSSTSHHHIAILIPEFPGQTHIFFWREMNELRRLGVAVHVISTRRPPADVICHDWSEQAIEQTRYLLPMGLGGGLAGLWTVITSGPRRWARCVGFAFGAKDAKWPDRIKALAMLPVAGQLLNVVRQGGYTHLHAHSCGNAATLATLAHLLGGVPYSLTLHSALSIFGSHQRGKWQHARFGITVTERLKQDVLNHCGNLDPDHIAVAPMGVDMNVFQRKTPYQPPQAGETWQLVTCGRLHRGKGHQDAIQAVALLRDRGRAVHLTILGEGPARANLEQQIHQLNLADHVTLAGSVSESTVRDTLGRSHLFVLGSHDEAIGVATMEAMAMALPVVVTNVGGVRELVRDQIDGRLIPPRDPQAMADAIEQTLTAPDIAQPCGQVGQQRIHERFGSDRSAILLLDRIKRRATHQANPATLKPTPAVTTP